MYEDQTYEAIMERCLSRVPDTMDKREGSIIYDALGPACAEVAGLYVELSNILDRAFPDTAIGTDLDRKAAERSVVRQPATGAIRKATFTGTSGAAIDVPVGTRFSGGGINYTATEKMETGAWKMTAETVGSVGNTYFGLLFPIDYVEGLAGAQLGDVLIPGDDQEDDESLRKRYFNSFWAQAFAGNPAAYREFVGALDGVGGVKVARAPSGGGTVGVTIVASDWAVPSTALIDMVQAAVDPVGNQGAGAGLAPIDHVVTVAGVVSRSVGIAFTLTLEDGVTWAGVKPTAEAAIQDYFDELTRSWADSVTLTVRISQIETRILSIPGVLDVEGTILNGAATNLQLMGTEIPVLGSVANGTA
ncbi:conserved hypothetical protein [uncultured Eubacteriales bacterium]|uniref:Uncharacterized protein n=1 Tax=uncultured Eubacteriales bacterium TaxID=172733 RepID=A0A212J4R7_9FIRM|nr:conserved hypothetical protein [uncultured Eubacteriales bacterium]